MAEENTSGNEYQKLAQLIEDIEASTDRQAPSSTTISMSGTFSAEGEAKPQSYQEMVQLIEATEAGRHPAKEKAQILQPQPHPHLVTSGVEQAKYAQVPVSGMPQAPTQKPAKQRKQKEAVSKELGQIAGKLGAGIGQFGEIGRKRININDLVLPNLSLADQISELERIIEGLRQQIFDKEHMEIVAQEVYGTRQYVHDAKKSTKTESLGELEQSLWSVRDQRIDEAITLIESYNVGSGAE